MKLESWYGYDRIGGPIPNSKDTDRDGILDGVECPERVSPKPPDPAWTPGVCRDTDGDNNPNIFDQDDDHDGVPSMVDASPYAYDNSVYSQTTRSK